MRQANVDDLSEPHISSSSSSSSSSVYDAREAGSSAAMSAAEVLDDGSGPRDHVKCVRMESEPLERRLPAAEPNK